MAQRGHQSPSSMEASAQEMYQSLNSVSRGTVQGQKPGMGKHKAS